MNTSTTASARDRWYSDMRTKRWPRRLTYSFVSIAFLGMISIGPQAVHGRDHRSAGDVPAFSPNLVAGNSSVPYEKGYSGYHCFRTPAIVKAQDRTLLAFAGGRKGGCGDDTDGDLVLRRSTDRGKSWKELQILDRG